MTRHIRTLFTAALLLASPTIAAMPAPEGLSRTDLQRHDLSAPGRETVQAIKVLDAIGGEGWRQTPQTEVNG